jgi:hypothetical protein
MVVQKLPRAPPCFVRHVKLLVPATFAVICTAVSSTVDVRQAVVKIIGELSQHDEKHVVPTPLRWDKGKDKL